MNLLQVTPYYAPAYSYGGVVRAVEGLATALVERGHRVTVLTTDVLSRTERFRGPSDETVNGLRVIRLPVRSIWLRGVLNLSLPQNFRGTARALMAEADITHSHEFRTVENLMLVSESRQLRQPLLMSPHGTLTYATGRSVLKDGWDRLFGRQIASGLSGVVALTAREREDVRALFATVRAPEPRIDIVPNGIRLENFSELTGGQAFRAKHDLGDAAMCLFMGRLHPRKGVDLLARAFLTANVAGAVLVFAGADDGALPILQSLLSDQVRYVGFLQGADRLAAWDAADVFALPATGEGFSMAALEALAVGIPAVLSPDCNFPEAEAAGAAFIVPPQVEPVAQALERLLTDASLRRVMGHSGVRLVESRYTWDHVAAEMESVYRHYL